MYCTGVEVNKPLTHPVQDFCESMCQDCSNVQIHHEEEGRTYNGWRRLYTHLTVADNALKFKSNVIMLLKYGGCRCEASDYDSSGTMGNTGYNKDKNTDNENNSRESSHTSVRESELEGEKEIQQKAKEEEKV